MQGPQRDPCLILLGCLVGVMCFCFARAGVGGLQSSTVFGRPKARRRHPGELPGAVQDPEQGAGLGVEVPEFGVEVASSGRGPGARGRGGEFEVEVPEF